MAAMVSCWIGVARRSRNESLPNKASLELPAYRVFACLRDNAAKPPSLTRDSPHRAITARLLPHHCLMARLSSHHRRDPVSGGTSTH